MIDLAATLRKSVYSPNIWIKELWFYNYQDFRLIFEQSDVLHYFYVSAATQRLIARAFIVAIGLVLCLIMGLVAHSAVSAWRYNNLEALKLESDKKKQEAFTALAALADDELSYNNAASQEELIRVAHSYRDRLNKMQTLVEFSSHELKLAYGALEKGLKASGVAANTLQKIKTAASSPSPNTGGPSEEISLGDENNRVIQAYKFSLEQLEQMKRVYKYFPTESPVANALTTSRYGVRTHPISHKLTIHEGLDYVPTDDAFARAVLPGKVEYVQHSNTGYGNMVTLLHPNKVRTIYAHLDSVNVKQGQTIGQGTVLGKVGNTGFSTGKHLHYEISIDNIKVNPSIITVMAKNVQ